MTTTVQLKLRGIFLADDSPENLTNPAGDFISTIFSPVVNFFLYLIGLPSQLFHDLTNFVGEIFSGVGNFFLYLIGLPVQLFQNLIHSVGDIFSDVGNFFQNLIDSVGEFFSTVVSTVTNFFPDLIGWFNQQFHNLVNSIGEFFSTVVSTVTNFFPDLIGWFNQEFQDLKTVVNEIFPKIVSDVSSFFHYLLDLFDQEFPPETRQRLIAVATPYLITAAVLTILCVCLWMFFEAVCVFFKGVWEFVVYITPCLQSGAKLGVEMMKAPGRPLLMISRAAFEANPQAYFLWLRGLPNNFVF